MDLSSTEEICSNSDIESYEDPEQIFLSNNYDNILDLYYELKEMFPMNPNFLCLLDSVTFCDYVTDLIFEKKVGVNYQTIQLSNDFFTFIEAFKHETHISFNSINNVLYNFNTKITIEQWEMFCFTYSELYKNELM
jgi:hypothetical protein